jgi:hypothetical protein
MVEIGYVFKHNRVRFSTFWPGTKPVRCVISGGAILGCVFKKWGTFLNTTGCVFQYFGRVRKRGVLTFGRVRNRFTVLFVEVRKWGAKRGSKPVRPGCEKGCVTQVRNGCRETSWHTQILQDLPLEVERLLRVLTVLVLLEDFAGTLLMTCVGTGVGMGQHCRLNWVHLSVSCGLEPGETAASGKEAGVRGALLFGSLIA